MAMDIRVRRLQQTLLQLKYLLFLAGFLAGSNETKGEQQN
jgi:hypothetical protein